MSILGEEGALTFIDESSNRRRDRHEIVAEILKTAREGRIKTHIMYKAKLSYSQINTYLKLLVGNGVLSQDEAYELMRRILSRLKGEGASRGDTVH